MSKPIKADKLIACAFCPGNFTVAEADAGKQAVLHSWPPCQKFVDMEPEDFVHEVYLKKVPCA